MFFLIKGKDVETQQRTEPCSRLCSSCVIALGLDSPVPAPGLELSLYNSQGKRNRLFTVGGMSDMALSFLRCSIPVNYTSPPNIHNEF